MQNIGRRQDARHISSGKSNEAVGSASLPAFKVGSKEDCPKELRESVVKTLLVDSSQSGNPW